MNVKEQAVRELDALRLSELLIVYDLILSLKSRVKKTRVKKPLHAYLKVREALSGYKGSMANDVLAAREDRMGE
jgi:hypothetical protein